MEVILAERNEMKIMPVFYVKPFTQRNSLHKALSGEKTMHSNKIQLISRAASPEPFPLLLKINDLESNSLYTIQHH